MSCGWRIRYSKEFKLVAGQVDKKVEKFRYIDFLTNLGYQTYMLALLYTPIVREDVILARSKRTLSSLVL